MASIALAGPALTREQKAIAQTKAIFGFEGIEASHQTKGIDAAVIAGRVTRTQAASELRAFVEVHKTTLGFLATRPWA